MSPNGDFNRPNDIPSPYNFVPLSSFIYLPEWSEQVSHDVPFSDGVSGTIKVSVTAKTPIYVRDGTAGEDKSPEFFQATSNGEYAIPGTSLKGMIRNVLEIISFGKMSRVDNHRYSIRDLYFRDYTNAMTKRVKGSFGSKVKAGWLTLNNQGQWMLVPCKYARVEQKDLEKYYTKATKKNLSIGQTPQKAKDKYFSWKTSLNIPCNIDAKEKSYKHSCGSLCYRKAQNLGSGKQTGTLVFTGQPMSRHRNRAKHMEFIFFSSSSTAVNVDNLKEEFKFIHSDDNGNPNDEWGYWKPKLENGQQIPVFYLEENNRPSSMGLAMMYRLPYKLSIHESIRNTSPSHLDCEQPDLAETIFGYVRKNGDALRGRVQVGHFLAEENPRRLPLVRTVLGSPKPTYYPNYVCQQTDGEGNVTSKISGNGKVRYKTFMDRDAKVRGWKRYGVRRDGHSPEPSAATQERVEVSFFPLPKDTTFTGTIRVHNLRQLELGAIVWALTWGKKENLRHLVGMAKPYGYGSVQIHIQSHDLEDIKGNPADLDDLCQAFEEKMQEKKSGWENSPQIQHLLAMADPNTLPPYEEKYPLLGEYPDPHQGNQPRRVNHFVDYKRNNKALRAYISRLEPNKEEESDSEEFQQGPGNYSKGEKVKCVVLEEKTKKGGWKFQIQGASEHYKGVLHPQYKDQIPEEIAPGQVYDMVIIAESQNNCQFKWAE